MTSTWFAAGVRWPARLLLWAGLALATARAEPIPALGRVPAGLPGDVASRLASRRQELERQLNRFLAEADGFNRKRPEDQTDAEYQALLARRAQYIGLVRAFDREEEAAVAASGASEQERFARDRAAWVREEQAAIARRLQEPNHLCAAITASLRIKEPPLPYKTFAELQPGDVLLLAPDDAKSRLIRWADRFSSQTPDSPASHTVLFLREVKGRRLFLDNQGGEGMAIITEEEFLRRYAGRLPASSVASLREPGCSVAQPLAPQEAQHLWQESAQLARHQLADRERKAGNWVDTSDYGLYGDDNMVCSEASRWALVRGLAASRPDLSLPDTKSPLKKLLGVYYGPANFYNDQEHFLITPLGVPARAP